MQKILKTSENIRAQPRHITYGISDMVSRQQHDTPVFNALSTSSDLVAAVMLCMK